MRCARVQERLTLYLAGELTPKENDYLSSHLARCAVCAALAEDLTATEERLTASLNGNVEPPATLDASVMAAIRALPVQPPFLRRLALTWRPLPRYALVAGLCCLVILSMAIGSMIGRNYPEKSVLELASLGVAHSRQAAASSPPQVRGSDAKLLTQELTSLVPFRVRAANLQSEGALLVGGSRTVVNNVDVAALHYKWEGHSISLFEMDGANSAPMPLRQMGHEPDSYYVHKAGNLAYVAWHSGKTDCVMVAEAVPMHQLFHLACRACERQE